ncbi:MAG TPA: hypothetical protein VG817_11070 [Gemmatimonadales bacterium]|nr:hypothetical protein [Gemmatimonadales bacterium]
MPPSTTARILHLALLSAMVLATLVLSAAPIPGASISPLFLYAVFGVAAVLFGGAMVIAARLPRDGTTSSDAWWSQNLSRAVVVWALLEGPSLLGAIAFLLSRDFTALVIPAAGVILFLLHSPSRLEQG